MSLLQSWMYFLLALVIATPVLAIEPAAEMPANRSVLRRGPVVQLPRADVDIVSAALAGADRKHAVVASTKTGSRWSGKPTNDAAAPQQPMIEIPGLESAGPPQRTAEATPDAKASGGLPFFERLRQRRLEAKVKAEARKEEKTATKDAASEGPILAPPEVAVPGQPSAATDPATASAPVRPWSFWTGKK